MAAKNKYKRILLKLSGEVLGGKEGKGIDFETLENFGRIITDVKDSGVKVAVVLGGGNFWRFRDFKNSVLRRTHSDTMGMIATIMNALALNDQLLALGKKVKVYSSFAIQGKVDQFNTEKATYFMDQGGIVICAGGTGNPFSSTDLAGVLRAGELGCDLMIKGSNVDYVYDKDPRKFKNAKAYKKLTYEQYLSMGLKVMDMSAVAMAQEISLPIAIFNLKNSQSLKEILKGGDVGTIIY